MMQTRAIFESLGSRLLFLPGRLARFETGDVGKEGIDLSGFKRESRHRRVTHDNALSQRLLERLDRIPLGQVAERRRKSHRTRTGFADGMTAGAILLGDDFSPLCRG